MAAGSETSGTEAGTSALPRGADVVRQLQRRPAVALPAEHVEELDGWWLRHTASRAWWTGAALPHADAGSDDLLRRVLTTERFYADHETPTRFQISPGACPEALDALLARRGYRWHGPMSLRVAETGRVATSSPSASVRVRIDTAPNLEWFEAWYAVHGHAGDRHVEWTLLERVPRLSAYATAMLDDEVVGVGRAVLDDGWAGVFGMAALPRARGRHVGRGILAALARWAAAREVDHLYLQVECDNTPARRLYEKAGFDEVCRYHYRVADPPHS